MYADNTTLLMSSNSRNTNQENLKIGLNILEDFMTSNKLTINRLKTTITEVMIGQKRARLAGNPPTLTETDRAGNLKTIYAQSEMRLLGMTIQYNMRWNAHLEEGEDALFPAARKKLGALREHTHKKNTLNLGIARKGGGGGFRACPNCLEHFFLIWAFLKKGGGVVGLPKLENFDFYNLFYLNFSVLTDTSPIRNGKANMDQGWALQET